MYLQITTRCNMHCDHCGFACTNQGEDMSLSTFEQALDIAADDSNIDIGGGEPTIHPHFWKMLGLSLATKVGFG